jgi:hypothetical protein
MSKDTLSEFGPEAARPKEPLSNSGVTHGGGRPIVKEMFHHSPPYTGEYNHHESGPGLHGTNWGNNGTQGPPTPKEAEVGSSGLHGQRLPHGSERGTNGKS